MATADRHANTSIWSNTFYKRKQNLLDGYELDLSSLSFECVLAKGWVGSVSRRVLVLKADEAGSQVATSVAPLLLLWALKQKWVG